MFSGDKLEAELNERKNKNLLRSLKQIPSSKTDFSSNDYLGFSRTGLLKNKISELQKEFHSTQFGSGGSRLLAGNNVFYEETEAELASFYQGESALIFNSGYDANLGFFSCVPKKDDFIFYDELIHASIHDGIRLSFAKSYKFSHNDLEDLKKKISLQDTKGKSVFIAIESVYSMDGDFAPLKELADYCEENNFALIVDEAHATGIFGHQGNGLCVETSVANKVFARLFTFGKALGAHGAAIIGSQTLKNYLVNFSRPFIFSTSLPFDSVLAIKAAHELLKDSVERKKLFSNIEAFRTHTENFSNCLPSASSIQALIIPGNEKVQQVSDLLFEKGFDVRPVKSPTVKEGTERLRISLHSFNSINEINRLMEELSSISVLKS